MKEGTKTTPEKVQPVKAPENCNSPKRPLSRHERIAKLPLSQSSIDYMQKRDRFIPYEEWELEHPDENRAQQEKADQRIGLHEAGHRAQCSMNGWHNRLTTVRPDSGLGLNIASPSGAHSPEQTAQEAISNAQAGYLTYELFGEPAPKSGAGSDIQKAEDLSEMLADGDSPSAVYARIESQTRRDLSSRWREIEETSFRLAVFKTI